MNQELEEDVKVEVRTDLEVQEHEDNHRQDCKGMKMKGNYYRCHPFKHKVVLNFLSQIQSRKYKEKICIKRVSYLQQITNLIMQKVNKLNINQKCFPTSIQQ